MVAVLRIVSLVVADSFLVATDGWFQVGIIILESSGSGRNIVVISVMACLLGWNHADGGGNSTADRGHRLGVQSVHLKVDVGECPDAALRKKSREKQRDRLRNDLKSDAKPIAILRHRVGLATICVF